MNADSLLQAITQTPGDDAPRLVYADWLEEHGDEAERERAEFIRLQIRQPTLDAEDRERLLLAIREQALLDRYREAWVEGVPSWARTWIEFARGMPFHLKVRAGQYLRRGKALRRAHLVEGVNLPNAGGLMPKLASSGLFAGLRSLALTSEPWRSGAQFAEADFPALATCKDLTEVVCLNLRHGQIPEVEPLRTLLTSERLPNLRELRWPYSGPGTLGAVAARQRPGIHTLLVDSSSPDPVGVAPLASSPGMVELHTLDISGCKLKDQGVAVLARGESLRQLRRLNLAQNDLKVGAIRALAESPVLQQLTHLNLQHSHLGEEGAKLLASSPNFAHLQELLLDSTNLEPAGLIHLARSQQLRSLTRLDLSWANFDQTAAEELSHSPLLANVVDLRIDNSVRGTEPEAIGLLLRSPAVRQVRYLEVGVNPMSPVIAAALAESPYLSRLEGLFLAQARMQDSHVEVLAQSPNLASVKMLDLSWNQIGEAGAVALARSPHLDSLVLLDLRETQVEQSGGAWLLRARFGDRVNYRNLRYQDT